MSGLLGPDDRKIVAFGPFRLDTVQRLLEKDGVPIGLGSRALDILICLVGRAGEIVSKDELIAWVWPSTTVEEANLRVHIASLRKALGDGREEARYVVNVAGRGYSFVAATTPVATVVPEQAAFRHQDVPPLRCDHMVGRDGEVSAISALLASQRFVTIYGPGGIGKTTVAIAVGQAQAGTFEGAVCFLDLGSFNDGTLLPGALAAALGITIRSSDPMPSLVHVLRGRRVLIILDNCEQVIEAAAALSEVIVREAPQIQLLATSREPLRAQGEQVYGLSSLGTPPDGLELTLSQVLAYPAARLLVERAAAGGFQTPLVEADAAVIAEICRKLDGIALAIEIVAGRIATYGLAQMAALLDGQLRLGWQGRRTAPSRHQTLNALLDWSYDLVSEAEQLALRRFSVFVGAFTLEAAVAVAADDRFGEDHIIAALEQLVAKSLVAVVHDDPVFRFRLLDTTRSYARAKLVEGSELAWVSRRHADYFLSALESRRIQDGSHDRAACFKRLGNIRAALDWSLGEPGASELAARLAAASVGLFIELPLLSECRFWAERAIKVLDRHIHGTRVEMELQSALGHSLMFTRGNGDQAKFALERSLRIAEGLGDLPGQFRLLSGLHMYSRRTRRFNRLLPLASQAEAIAAEIGDPVGIAGAHVLLGVSHHLLGAQDEARRQLEASWHRRPDIVPVGHFAFHRNPNIGLARILWLQGHPDQAIALASRLPDKEFAETDPVTFCIALIWGASVFQWVGRWDVVEDFAERLHRHAEARSLEPYQAVAQGLSGEALVHRGAVELGMNLLRSALASLHADQYQLYTPSLSCTLATSLAAVGRAEQGLTIIDECIAFSSINGEGFDLPELLRVRGEILALGDRVSAAEDCFRQAMTLADRQGALSWRLRAVMSHARLPLQSGRLDETREELRRIVARFTEGFETADLRAAHAVLDGAA